MDFIGKVHQLQNSPIEGLTKIRLYGSSFFINFGFGLFELMSRYFFSSDNKIYHHIKNTLSNYNARFIQQNAKNQKEFGTFEAMLNIYSNPPENFSQIFGWLYKCARTSDCQNAVSAVLQFIFNQECSNQSFFPTDPIQKEFLPDLLYNLSTKFKISICLTDFYTRKVQWYKTLQTRCPNLFIMQINENLWLMYSEKMIELEGMNYNQNLDQILFSYPFVGDEGVQRETYNTFESPKKYHPLTSQSSVSGFETPIYLKENPQPSPIDLYEKMEYLVSKRTDLSMLNLNPTTLVELKLRYSQCIGIGQSFNQFRAFATAIKEALMLESNKNWKNQILERFNNKQTFTGLRLENKYDFDTKNIKKLVTYLKEIYMEALKNFDCFDEDLKNDFLADEEG